MARVTKGPFLVAEQGLLSALGRDWYYTGEGHYRSIDVTPSRDSCRVFMLMKFSSPDIRSSVQSLEASGCTHCVGLELKGCIH